MDPETSTLTKRHCFVNINGTKSNILWKHKKNNKQIEIWKEIKRKYHNPLRSHSHVLQKGTGPFSLPITKSRALRLRDHKIVIERQMLRVLLIGWMKHCPLWWRSICVGAATMFLVCHQWLPLFYVQVPPQTWCCSSPWLPLSPLTGARSGNGLWGSCTGFACESLPCLQGYQESCMYHWLTRGWRCLSTWHPNKGSFPKRRGMQLSRRVVFHHSCWDLQARAMRESRQSWASASQCHLGLSDVGSALLLLPFGRRVHDELGPKPIFRSGTGEVHIC